MAVDAFAADPQEDVVMETRDPAMGEDEEEEETESDPATDFDAPLQRTKSQAIKRIKVDEVTQALEERREPVQLLRKALSQLSASGAAGPSPEVEEEPAAKKLARATAQMRQVERLQQGFRNFGEDLMEGMLKLDGLSGLAEEDRLVRKETIRGLQNLLDDIDGAKPRVEKLRSRVEAELQQLEEQQPQQEAAPTAQPPSPLRERLRGERPPQQGSGARGQAAPASSRRPRVRSAVDWRRVRLPVEFSTGDRGGAYVLAASAPGLEPGSVRLSRRDGGVLRVEGLRLPTASERRALDRAVAAQLAALPRDRVAKVAREDVDELAARLGRGRFGLLHQEFELPRDVDWSGIEADYNEDGVLSVVLPRMHAAARGFGGQRRSSQPRGFGYPGGLAGSFAGLSRGGMSDFMW